MRPASCDQEPDTLPGYGHRISFRIPPLSLPIPGYVPRISTGYPKSNREVELRPGARYPPRILSLDTIPPSPFWLPSPDMSPGYPPDIRKVTGRVELRPGARYPPRIWSPDTLPTSPLLARLPGYVPRISTGYPKSDREGRIVTRSHPRLDLSTKKRY